MKSNFTKLPQLRKSVIVAVENKADSARTSREKPSASSCPSGVGHRTRLLTFPGSDLPTLLNRELAALPYHRSLQVSAVDCLRLWRGTKLECPVFYQNIIYADTILASVSY